MLPFRMCLRFTIRCFQEFDIALHENEILQITIKVTNVASLLTEIQHEFDIVSLAMACASVYIQRTKLGTIGKMGVKPVYGGFGWGNTRFRLLSPTRRVLEVMSPPVLDSRVYLVKKTLLTHTYLPKPTFRNRDIYHHTFDPNSFHRNPPCTLLDYFGQGLFRMKERGQILGAICFYFVV